MPDEETQLAQDTSADNSGEIRKKAMTRLIVAGAVTAAALAALWWLDRTGAPDKKPAKAPAPIVAAPAPIAEPAAPTTEAPPVESKPEPPPPPQAPEASTDSKPAEAPSAAKRPPAPGAAPARATPATSIATPVTPPSPAAKPASAPAAAPAKAEAPAAFVVQLGVFADPTNAKDLVERLGKLGVQARMETRVQVGPFGKREEAEKARDAMLKLGVKGVVATK